MKKQYRIEWLYLDTNYSNQGPWHESKQVIESWVEHHNGKYNGEIKHWLAEKE